MREEIRLNKFIAHGGFCSRRDADEWIERGEVKVNGEVITEHGVKVRADDRVEVRGQRIRLEPFVYLLLHKSKDTISTTDDEKGRYTVMDAIEKATGARVYPVGRLDRDTTGLLLLTNDGDLAHRLMHPSYKVKKVYEVETDPPLGDGQLQELAQGIELEDGPVTPLKVRRSMTDPSLIEISIHEGRNHLVRRIVNHYGADVSRLKRVRYSGLTLEGVNMDRWRHLKRPEVNQLRKSVKLEPLHEEREKE
ncbi:MAG: pseudouridine synthase [Bacteroidota bacterium]